MPVYEFSISAKVYIRMEGENSEKACENLESVLEDFYIQIPCQGHEIHFGRYPASVWINDTKPILHLQLPEGTDPTKSTQMKMHEWMKRCLEPIDLTEEDAIELKKLLGKEGKDLPEANKEELLKKHKLD